MLVLGGWRRDFAALFGFVNDGRLLGAFGLVDWSRRRNRNVRMHEELPVLNNRPHLKARRRID
jgi:hypothetical protein